MIDKDKNHNWKNADQDLLQDEDIKSFYNNDVEHILSMQTFRNLHGFKINKCVKCGLIKVGKYTSYNSCEEYLISKILDS